MCHSVGVDTSPGQLGKQPAISEVHEMEQHDFIFQASSVADSLPWHNIAAFQLCKPEGTACIFWAGTERAIGFDVRQGLQVSGDVPRTGSTDSIPFECPASSHILSMAVL